MTQIASWTLPEFGGALNPPEDDLRAAAMWVMLTPTTEEAVALINVYLGIESPFSPREDGRA